MCTFSNLLLKMRGWLTELMLNVHPPSLWDFFNHESKIIPSDVSELRKSQSPKKS